MSEIPALLERLESLRLQAPEPAAMAFDADGVLWQGDVAEDVFHHAVSTDALRTDARSALADVAGEQGLATEGSASAIAKRLFDGYVQGRVEERLICEVMTWCFAGFSLDELESLTRTALAAANLPARAQRFLEPVFGWAEARGVGVHVVSASPGFIVREGARALFGLDPARVYGCEPALDQGRLTARLRTPVPYADDKPRRLLQEAPDAHLLAAFGDSLFDLPLLKHARLGVLVRPRRALLERRHELVDPVILSGS